MVGIMAAFGGNAASGAKPAPGGKHDGIGNADAQSRKIVGQRKYSIIVNEGNDSILAEFNRGIGTMRGNRGLLSDMLGLYRSTFVGKAVGASSALLDFGISAVSKAVENKRPKWEKAVQGESRFRRRLPMQMEILDFYRSPSTIGPLDPTDMFFNGFGCRQVIEYRDADGTPREEEVFYMNCKVRTDSVGRSRMLNHSKFEVYVDSIRFNYALCDLPNDSLGTNIDSRIGFSFDKRKDLRFEVDATVTSSWINQAMQVYDNTPLGTFHIEAQIDPRYIDDDGIFTYSARRDKGSGKRVTATGDCFLVPRSYVGSTDMHNTQDSWGTGQYKVEMEIGESCAIDRSYYMTDGKWDKRKWGPEWKKISSRKKGNVWRQVLTVLGMEYKDSKWVTTLLEPAKSAIIQHETKQLTRLTNSIGTSSSAGGATGAAGAGAAGAGAGKGGQSPAGGKTGAGAGKPAGAM